MNGKCKGADSAATAQGRVSSAHCARLTNGIATKIVAKARCQSNATAGTWVALKCPECHTDSRASVQHRLTAINGGRRKVRATLKSRTTSARASAKTGDGLGSGRRA